MLPSQGVVNGNLHHILCVHLWCHPIYRPTTQSPQGLPASSLTAVRRADPWRGQRLEPATTDAATTKARTWTREREERAGDRVHPVSRWVLRVSGGLGSLRSGVPPTRARRMPSEKRALGHGTCAIDAGTAFPAASWPCLPPPPKHASVGDRYRVPGPGTGYRAPGTGPGTGYRAGTAPERPGVGSRRCVERPVSDSGPWPASPPCRPDTTRGRSCARRAPAAPAPRTGAQSRAAGAPAGRGSTR